MFLFESSEALFLVGVYTQPVLLGFILFFLARPGLLSRVLFLQLKAPRRRTKSTRFFECAAYSRLVGQFRLELLTLGLALAFIVYDVDLVFFLAEATCWQHWG